MNSIGVRALLASTMALGSCSGSTPYERQYSEARAGEDIDETDARARAGNAVDCPGARVLGGEAIEAANGQSAIDKAGSRGWYGVIEV